MRKALVFLIILCLATVGHAQTVTYISNLPDTLKPSVVLLEEVPAPRSITVPSSKGKSYTIPTTDGVKTIPLLPPEIKKLPVVTTDLAGTPLTDQSASGLGLFTNYDTDDGLALDFIGFGNSMLCDKRGNLWFGTQGGGVSKYDGRSFTTYTTAQGLGNDIVRSMIEDKAGNLWFSTNGGGATKYDGRTFTTYTEAQGLASNNIFSTMEDEDGNIWFGTDGSGVTKYDGNSFTTYTTADGLADNTVWSMVQSKDGQIWFGTYQGVSKYDGNSFTNFTTANGLANNSVRSMVQDKDGHLWFGTFSGGVTKYDGSTFTTYTKAQGLGSNTVWNITEDSDGNLWFGTQGGGATKYDGNSFTTYTTAQGLANNTVWCIVEDKSGNLWFGTQGGGVSKYGGSSFITTLSLADKSVFSMFEDNAGNLWFGTRSAGLYKYDGRSVMIYSTAQGLAENNIRCMAQDREGNMWFGTFSGVCKFDGTSFTTYTTAQGLASNSVMDISLDKHGNIWFATHGGVSKFDGNSFINFTTAQGLAGNSVRCVIQDSKGNLWFGTRGGGVSKYDGLSFSNYTTTNGLSDNTVWSIAEDKHGNLWFATAEGLSLALKAQLQQNDDSENLDFFKTFTKHEGLPDNFLTAVKEDNSGNILLGSNFGLWVIPESKVQEITSGQTASQSLKGLKEFSQFTGYPIRDVNTGQDNGAMLVDSKGIIWVGHGSNGVTSVDLNAIKRINPPKLFIQSIMVEEEDICWYNLLPADSATNAQQEILSYGKLLEAHIRDSLVKKFSRIQFDSITSWFPLPEVLVLPHSLNSVTFDFIGIETGKNHLIRYQYMLEGYSKGWSPVTDKTSVTFGNISEGTYTFKVRARSSDGHWSDPTTYVFNVLPPWYRTWWMFAVYALLAISIVGIIVWVNGRMLRAQKKVLATKVQKRTVQLEERNNLVEEQKHKIEEKHKKITDSIRYAKRIQQAVLPPLDAMQNTLKDSFVFYRPKDVVAGDFFWLETHKDKIFFAAADCTGHGVPGAMVSVICAHALSKALLEEDITETGKLLDRTREIVISRFAKSKEEVKDGMDISLCAIDFAKMSLQWSGANNPLWIIRKDASEIEVIKGDRQPVGVCLKNNPFTTHDLKLQPGDTLYLFSDGYPDQFGGEKEKRYNTRQLKEKLLSIKGHTLKEQKLLLEEEFDKWRGDLEQIDDVCLIGVRIV